MGLAEELRKRLEQEEKETVGNAFGGTVPPTRTSYSVTSVRDWLIAQPISHPSTPIEQAVISLKACFDGPQLKHVVECLLRFSFLIELTNLKIGSTKMKTRWLPGSIKMPKPGTFEPVDGTFAPGNDPRAADFHACLDCFVRLAGEVCADAKASSPRTEQIKALRTFNRVPYEFPIAYIDDKLQPLHAAKNVKAHFVEDLAWLLRARQIMNGLPETLRRVLDKICQSKLDVKVYKTDRSLTGKDKTNRAKRWEVLPGDFQYATLQQCWSAERKLTADLVCFHDAPKELKQAFVEAGLLKGDEPPTRCPVTLELLSYAQLADATLNPDHGKSDYQIGHRNPLKTGGKHEAANVCWQSADGNRIQGNLTIAETNALLDRIFTNRKSVS